MSEQSLKHKHALITGGGRGIGAAVARRLDSQGARVTLLGRDLKVLEKTAQPLQSAFVIAADVTDEQAVNNAFALAAEKMGTIDILVNNAGAAQSAAFTKTDSTLWSELLAVNLDSVFYCSKSVLPAMKTNGWGRIINIASTAGLTGYAYVSAYCAAKHGVIGLTRALAKELARSGITVNAVCPGFTDTGMTSRSIANIVAKTGRSEAHALAELVKHNPQGRLVTPDEVADTVAWLAGEQASAINGQAIAVAGGELA